MQDAGNRTSQPAKLAMHTCMHPARAFSVTSRNGMSRMGVRATGSSDTVELATQVGWRGELAKCVR